MPFTLANPIGRLVQVRMTGLMTLEEAQQIRTSMYLLLSALTGKAIILTDMLQAEQFSAEVGERMLEMLTHDNPKVDRTGFLMRRGPFSLRIERICSEATRLAKAAEKTPAMRRVFFQKEDVYAWLSDALSPAERVGLRGLMGLL